MINAIQPVQVFPSTATLLQLTDFYAYPNSTLNCQWALLDSGNNVLSVGRTSLTPAQYSGWGGHVDDTVYLPDCFSQVLGLTLITGS